MSEMVDRVAKAMVEFLITTDPTTTPWDEADEEMRDAMREAVRPQIAAMREPTNDMIGAGAMETGVESYTMMCGYQAMIDEALK